MRLTRRDVHKGFAALLATSLTGRMASAATPTSPDDIFLNRLTFGANPQSRAELASAGREAWLDAQLGLPATGGEIDRRLSEVRLWIEFEAGESSPREGDDPVAYDAVAEFRPLQHLGQSPEELVKILDPYAPLSWAERARPVDEVRIMALLRAVHAPAQIREVMTQFWHDHFNVNSGLDEVTGVLFPAFDRDLRTHALGNFHDLLVATATAPVMLRYLNNDESRASPANENYARELLELHTLGQDAYFNDLYENWREVPGALDGLASGYIDDDVYEVARALTGWSIGAGEYYDTGGETPQSGRLAYIERWHDPYQKRILGVEFEANAPPLADGMKVLEILSHHPATARFVSTKILRRLGIEDASDAYLTEIAAVFSGAVDAPDQIAQVIRAIVAHSEFDATPPTKLRRPFEFLAAIYRATGAEISPRQDDMGWSLHLAGWHQHQVHPPTGHSDLTIDWANTRTISGLLDLALESHGDWMNLTGAGLLKHQYGVTDMADLAGYWQGRFGLEDGTLNNTVVGLGLTPNDAVPYDDEGQYEWINIVLVASAALDRKFLFR